MNSFGLKCKFLLLFFFSKNGLTMWPNLASNSQSQDSPTFRSWVLGLQMCVSRYPADPQTPECSPGLRRPLRCSPFHFLDKSFALSSHVGLVDLLTSPSLDFPIHKARTTRRPTCLLGSHELMCGRHLRVYPTAGPNHVLPGSFPDGSSVDQQELESVLGGVAGLLGAFASRAQREGEGPNCLSNSYSAGSSEWGIPWVCVRKLVLLWQHTQAVWEAMAYLGSLFQKSQS